MRSPAFIKSALIIGIAGATALGLIAATTVPTQISSVEDTWRDRYGWKGDVTYDGGSQEIESYALADNVTPTWLFNSASLPTGSVQDDRDISYNDYALPSDRYDYVEYPVDELAGPMTASYNAEPLALEDAAETAARSAEQAMREVRMAEAAPADAQLPEPAPNSGAGERPVEVLGTLQP